MKYYRKNNRNKKLSLILEQTLDLKASKNRKYPDLDNIMKSINGTKELTI